MSDSEKNPGPDDPAYYAPRRLRDIGAPVDKNWRAPIHQDLIRPRLKKSGAGGLTRRLREGAMLSSGGI